MTIMGQLRKNEKDLVVMGKLSAMGVKKAAESENSSGKKSKMEVIFVENHS